MTYFYLSKVINLERRHAPMMLWNFGVSRSSAMRYIPLKSLQDGRGKRMVRMHVVKLISYERKTQGRHHGLTIFLVASSQNWNCSYFGSSKNRGKVLAAMKMSCFQRRCRVVWIGIYMKLISLSAFSVLSSESLKFKDVEMLRVDVLVSSVSVAVVWLWSSVCRCVED